MRTLTVRKLGIVAFVLAAVALLVACSPTTQTPTSSPLGTAARTGQPSAAPTVAPATGGTATAAPTAVPATPTAPAGSLPPQSLPPPGTPGPITPGAGLGVEWRSAPAPGLGIVLGLSDAASAGGRVVIIGDATEEFIPRIWTSTDGAAWTQAAFPDESNSLQLTAVAAGGPGFVAFASDYDTGAAVAYVSADGLAWQRVDDTDFQDESIYSVGTAGTTIVAVSDSGSILTSTDGLSWVPAQDQTSFDVGDGLLDLVGYNGSLWAFGQNTELADEQQAVDVWRTDDGLTWTSVGTIPGSEGALELWSAIGPKGFVVLADVDQGDSFGWTAWHSTDGVTWQPANNSPSSITDLIATDVGFVASAYYNLEGGCAVDETQNVGLTWTSANGMTWRLIPETEDWIGREILVLGQIGRTVAGVGVQFEPLYADPVTESGLSWTADLPAEATDTAPPPPPTPEPTFPPDCG